MGLQEGLYLRDLTGYEFPAGAVIGRIGWGEVPPKPQFKRREDELITAPVPMFVIGEPHLSNQNPVLWWFSKPLETTLIRLRVDFRDQNTVVLVLRGKEIDPLHPDSPLGVITQYEFKVAGDGVAEDTIAGYQRCQQYAINGPLLLFELLDTVGGNSVRTEFLKRKASSSGRWFFYQRRRSYGAKLKTR